MPVIHGNTKYKKADYIKISDTVVFKRRNITRDKVEHFIIIRESFYQEEKTILMCM